MMQRLITPYSPVYRRIFRQLPLNSRSSFLSCRRIINNNTLYSSQNYAGIAPFSTYHHIKRQQQQEASTTTTTATNTTNPISFDNTIIDNNYTGTSPSSSQPLPSPPAHTTPPKKKRRLVPLREPFKLTEAAAKRVSELLHNKENAVGLKVSMTRRGCNGLTTVLDYVYRDNIPKFHEEVTDKSGIKIYVDPSALMYVIGTVMDYVDDEVRSEFVFNNPNAQSTCGCGDSVSVPEKVAKLNQKAIEKFKQHQTHDSISSDSVGA